MNHRDWQYLKPWLKQLRSVRLQIFIGLGLATATALFGIGLLSLSGWFITAAALYTAFDIYTPGAGIRFFAVTRPLSRYVERLINHDAVLKLQARWRVALFKRLQGRSLASLAPLRVADGVQYLARNLDAMDNLLLRLMAPMLVFVLSSCLLILFWGIYIPSAAIALAIAALLVLFVSARMAKQARALAMQQLQSTQRLRRQSMAFTESATELLAWGAYKTHRQALLKQAQRQEQLDDKQLAMQHKTLWLVEIFSHSVFLLAVILSGFAFESGMISSADMIMLVLSALAWQEIAAELPSQWGGYGKTVAAAKHLLANEASVQKPVKSHSSKSLKKAISLTLDNISVKRGKRVLIRPVSAQFKPGYVHWLNGPSGLGKSSLAEAIMGWLPCFTGKITLSQGADVDNHISFLTQRTEVLDGSIRENLNLSHQPIGDEELWAVLQLVELDNVVRALPESLNTLVGARGVMLSGGQLRRLVLARVLLQGRPIILLDEPFAGLERQLAKRMLENIVAAYKDKTWIIISHLGPNELDNPKIPQGETVVLKPF